ncbi:SIMPL domain-containing protein [Propionivibrio sp.]|uniref:SIMPL domain-containing protein n=1 Tax=Propionivibrio sp. TaxID=2212460 RepID=UPI003BF199DA
MTNLLRSIRTLPLLAFLIAIPALAAPTIIELSSEASRPAINDLVRATVSAEATGTTLGELSKQVNSLIAEALKTAKAFPRVKTQSGNTSTYPIYSKGGKIESWRIRSELSLESGDTAALSELLGKLQSSLGVSNLVLQPSPETRKKAENEAMLDAIAAFKARAKVIADAFGKPYRIKQLSVNTSGNVVQPLFRATAKAMMADAAPMPMEAGESQISATVSGQIELE